MFQLTRFPREQEELEATSCVTCGWVSFSLSQVALSTLFYPIDFLRVCIMGPSAFWLLVVSSSRWLRRVPRDCSQHNGDFPKWGGGDAWGPTDTLSQAAEALASLLWNSGTHTQASVHPKAV